MNLADFLTDAAHRIPDHDAVRFGHEVLTFSEMDRRVDALVRGLIRRGLEPRERCVLMMPNSPNWVLT